MIRIANLSYSSFPITENNTEVLNTIAPEDDNSDDEPSFLVYFLRAIFKFYNIKYIFLI